MSYIRDNLMPNEKVIFSARVHPAILTPAGISFIAVVVFVVSGLRQDEISRWFSFLIAGMFLLITIRLVLEALVALLTTEFAVTNRRVIAKTGFIHRRTLELLIPKIESVAVYQNIVGRMFNFGSVTVIGTGGTREKFGAIADPMAIRRKLNQVIENNSQAYAEYQRQKESSPKAGG